MPTPLYRKLTPFVRFVEILAFLTISAQMASAAPKVKAIVASGNLNFSNVLVSSSAQLSMTISNSGSTTISISSISLPAGFSTTFTTASLPVAGKVTAFIRFSPTAAQNYTGTATVNSSATSGTRSLPVSGAGVGQTIALAGNLSFGNVVVSSNAQKILTISSTGTSNLTISSISYPAGFSGNFSGGVLAPGTFTNVTVTFSPTIVTNYSGTITVNSDKLGGTNTIAASGTGTVPVGATIVLSGNLSFGNVPVNTSTQGTLVISNSGAATLHVTNVTYPTGFSGAFTGAIAPGKSTNVTVTFSPTAATPYGGSATVTSDAIAGVNTRAVSGTGAGGAIALGGNLSFGNLQANTSTQSTLVISNSGNATLNISNITYPSGFSGGFAGPIAPGLTTNVTVTFSPTAGITYSGSVTVKSDAVSGANTIAISGTGVGGRIVLSGNLNFSNVVVNSSAQGTLVISNAGAGTMTVSSISYPAGFSGDFTGTLATATSANVPVTFSPTAAIKYGGPIAVNSDALSGTNTISASGTGVRARIAVSGNLSFGNVPVNTSVQQNLVISNSGTATLVVTNINYPVGFSGDFSGALAPGTVTNVTVTFNPTDTTNYSGTVTVVSDASSGTSTNTASGTGVAPVIALSGDLSFGGVIVGLSGQLTLTITNTGSATLNVSSIDYPPGFSGSFSGAIAPGDKTNVTVTFTPAIITNYNGVVTVNSDAFKGANTVNASGAGVASTRIIALSGDLNFGDIFVGSTAHLTLTITNIGNSDLTFTNIELPGQYVANITNGTIVPGATTNVDVAFTPLDTGNHTGNLTVDSDATSGTNVVSVIGRGTNVASPVIVLSGNLDFGDVMVGAASHLNLTISNGGNATLTVSNINCPSGFSSSFAGAIEPGTATNATITFSPVAAQPYSGSVTVVSDAVSGANSAEVSGDAFSYAAANALFNGLYYPSNNVTFTNSGYFRAKTSTKNTLSAKIRLAGKQYSVSGTLSGTGSFAGQILRKGLSTLNVTIQLGFDGGNVLKGTVTDGTFAADLLANRSIFNSKTNLAPQTGIYTITIAGTNALALTNGTGTVTVMSSGATKVLATLGDGTHLTQVTAVGQSGQLPLFGSLYSNKGSIIGWLTFGNTVGDELNGPADWFKPAGFDLNNPNGFSFTTSLTGAKQ